MRVEHPTGGYAFTPSKLRFASGGVIATNDSAIDHAVFPEVVPMHAGFDLVEQYLEQLGRPLTALCGFDLRVPTALPWGEFDEFNELYFDRLKRWNLLNEDGTSPLARTNVAPLVNPPDEPGVLGFSYTTESSGASSTFVVSGVAELMDPFRMPEDLVRAGASTPDALLEKTQRVVEVVVDRLAALGVGWDDSVVVHLYSGHDIAHGLRRGLLAAIGVRPAHGLVWHDTAPPVLDLELEIDVRRYQREIAVRPRT
jgi:hypothetical protein